MSHHGNWYFCLSLGEDRFLTLQKKNIRASKDWLGGKWIDLKPKPDILVLLSENVTPSLKPEEESGLEAQRTPKVDDIKGGQRLADLAESVDLLVNLKDSNSRKRPQISNEDEINNSISSDGESDSNDSDADAGNEKKSVSEEDLCPYKTCEAPEALK